MAARGDVHSKRRKVARADASEAKISNIFLPSN